jgi:hypothetical protein
MTKEKPEWEGYLQDGDTFWLVLHPTTLFLGESLLVSE